MSKTKLPIEYINADKSSVDEIINECEAYRKRLTYHCQLHFKLNYDDACDCVSQAYAALYESLLNGIEIKNYRAWLYQVTMNVNNKMLKDKIRRNEYEFLTNEDKDLALENTLTYEPDYVENMVDDLTIEKRYLKIIASLNDDERDLYISRYLKKQSFAEIAEKLNLDSSTVGKRHKKLKNKIIKMVKDFENN